MKLEKFPITTKRQQYRVTIKERNSLGEHVLLIKIYAKRKGMLRHVSKWIKLHESKFDPKYVENGVVTFKGVAVIAVQDFEKYIDRLDSKDNKLRTAIVDWNNWDGKIRGKYDE